MKAKPGQLKMGWSKREGDIMFAWGGQGADRSDAGLLNCVMTIPLRNFDKSFQQELIDRGYDITTIRFSIQKMARRQVNDPATTPPPATPEP